MTGPAHVLYRSYCHSVQATTSLFGELSKPHLHSEDSDTWQSKSISITQSIGTEVGTSRGRDYCERYCTPPRPQAKLL